MYGWRPFLAGNFTITSLRYKQQLTCSQLRPFSSDGPFVSGLFREGCDILDVSITADSSYVGIEFIDGWICLMVPAVVYCSEVDKARSRYGPPCELVESAA